jgi:hypothetical protein
MTHESFKQIMTFSDTYTKEDICNFLDGNFEDAVLNQWFDLWKDGKQRQIFDEIKSMNQLKENISKNDVERKPVDFDKPRGKQNKNLEKMQKQKQMKKDILANSKKNRRAKLIES